LSAHAPAKRRRLAAGIVVAASIAILAAGNSGAAIWLHYVCKPLATLLILAWAWRTNNPVNARYRAMVLAGIVLSVCGDIFLMLPASVFTSGFICGLGSFLIAHLLFLRALTSDTALFGKPQALLAFAAIGAINMAILWPGLPQDLQLPILVYVACLTSMAAQASSRWLDLHTPASRLAACGGALFFLSDTLIAYDRFDRPIMAAEVWILGTYYAALWLIAASVANRQTASQPNTMLS
jgi:uncharacterized membrane protein YhhN